MDRMTTDGVGLAYEVRGHGQPVVLIHAGVCADFFAPLMDEPALAGTACCATTGSGTGAATPSRARSTRGGRPPIAERS